MTYKEKMNKECPVIDPDFVLFSCPGHYFDGAPNCNYASCPASEGVKCGDCWNTEVPESKPESTDQSPDDAAMVKKIAKRVKALYLAFRDEDLNHQEAFEFTKIIIAEEVRNGSPMLR